MECEQSSAGKTGSSLHLCVNGSGLGCPCQAMCVASAHTCMLTFSHTFSVNIHTAAEVQHPQKHAAASKGDPGIGTKQKGPTHGDNGCGWGAAPPHKPPCSTCTGTPSYLHPAPATGNELFRTPHCAWSSSIPPLFHSPRIVPGLLWCVINGVR